MSSSEADDHDHECSKGEIPRANVSQTKLWLSVEDPSILTPAEIVAANNLGIVAQQNEKLMSMMTKLVADMDSSAASSRQSSVRAASIGNTDDGTGAEGRMVDAYNKLRGEYFDIIYQAFRAFISASGKLSLATRSRNMVPNSKAFTKSAIERMSGFEDEDARIAAELMGAIADDQAIELYISLSRRFKGEKIETHEVGTPAKEQGGS